MFPRLIDAGRMRDIHVAWDKDGKLVGATVAALHKEGEGPSPMHDALAWPDTLGMSLSLPSDRSASKSATKRPMLI